MVAETESAPSRREAAIRPSEVRPRLAEAAASSLDEIERVLLETATGANRQIWVTIACKHCDRQGRYEIIAPDYRVRLDAVETLLRQGLGRPREADYVVTPTLPDDPSAIERLAWSDLQALAAIHLPDFERDQLRERLASLGEAQRRLLRETLDEVA